VVGQSLSHYRIIGQIGRGGMGDVFKAEDTRLKRLVAVKVITQGLAGDESSRRRFVQEARASSALDHQNICTVHDIGETPDGRLFLVLAYYEGETLAATIRRGPLPLPQISAIMQQVLSGLHRAHEYGIVHRDIKPGNLFITRFNEVKILDFGLAKLRGGLVDTQPGEVVGTVPYMSPEQIACAPVDARSDIWSLGVVLYEMIAGRRPFDGDNAAAIFYSVLYQVPKALAELRPEVPRLVTDLVERMLAKSPDARPQSCREVARLLIGSPEAATSRPLAGLSQHHQRSIMVLPFISLAGDNESDYFGHGLADEVTTNLSHVSALRVIARSAAERVSATGRNVRAARELGVDYVVDGAVRRQGSALRVSANLIEARTGAILWAEQFRGSLDDIFSIQESLSRSIVDALRIRLSVDERERFAENPLSDVAAYGYYLKAKQEFVRYAPGGLDRALNYIEAARARAGDNVLLLAAAGQIYWQLVNSGISLDRRYIEKARLCAERILELDRESPHGYRLIGMSKQAEGDIRSAIRFFELAATKDPNDTDTLSLLGPCYGYVGRPHSGNPCVARLLELDPVTPMYQCMPGILAMMAGRFEEAIEPFATSFRLDPGNPLVGLCYGQCLALNGQVPQAIEVFDDLQRRFTDSFMARLGQLYRCALLGLPEQTSRWMNEDVIAVADWDLYHAWNLAECFTLLGDTELALRWLARAADRGMLNYPLLSSLDPFLEGLRSVSGFEEIMSAVRNQWEDVNSAADSSSAATR
jgi:non-specific serine/threonine protein kinase